MERISTASFTVGFFKITDLEASQFHDKEK
jgi:hypothetical protein